MGEPLEFQPIPVINRRSEEQAAALFEQYFFLYYFLIDPHRGAYVLPSNLISNSLQNPLWIHEFIANIMKKLRITKQFHTKIASMGLGTPWDKHFGAELP